MRSNCKPEAGGHQHISEVHLGLSKCPQRRRGPKAKPWDLPALRGREEEVPAVEDGDETARVPGGKQGSVEARKPNLKRGFRKDLVTLSIIDKGKRRIQKLTTGFDNMEVTDDLEQFS